MKKSDIKAEIASKVGNQSYDIWRIGLTHDLEERKKYWTETVKQNTKYWSQWEADSLSDAQDIELYFTDKGLKGGTGGDLSPDKTVFLYVF